MIVRGKNWNNDVWVIFLNFIVAHEDDTFIIQPNTSRFEVMYCFMHSEQNRKKKIYKNEWTALALNSIWCHDWTQSMLLRALLASFRWHIFLATRKYPIKDSLFNKFAHAWLSFLFFWEAVQFRSHSFRRLIVQWLSFSQFASVIFFFVRVRWT